jgi:hypothetical protein
MAWFDFMNQANARGRDAGSIARQRLNARAGMPVPGGAVPRGGILGPATAGVTLGEFVATPLAIGAANYLRSPQGQLVKDRLGQLDIPGAVTALTGIGRNNAPRLTSYNPPGFDPSKPVSTRDLLNTAREVGNITGRGLGGNAPAERAYQQEVSRVAQLTAQDPELQRYEEARQKAKLAGPGSAAEQSAEDLGMQIWAKKYGKPGDLASRVKPSQAGYDVIQRTLGAGQMGSPLNLPFDTNSPFGTTPPISPASYDAGKVAQGLGLSTVPRNAFAGASAAPYAGFSQGPTLQSAPLGFPSEMPTASYAGATGIQPMGSAVDKFDPKGPEAQRLLEMFKDSIFTTQK